MMAESLEKQLPTSTWYKNVGGIFGYNLKDLKSHECTSMK